jgi:hypothetical protein
MALSPMTYISCCMEQMYSRSALHELRANSESIHDTKGLNLQQSPHVAQICFFLPHEIYRAVHSPVF